MLIETGAEVAPGGSWRLLIHLQQSAESGAEANWPASFDGFGQQDRSQLEAWTEGACATDIGHIRAAQSREQTAGRAA